MVRGYLGPVTHAEVGTIMRTAYARPENPCVVVANASHVRLVNLSAMCSTGVLIVNSSDVEVVGARLSGAGWLEPRLRGMGIFVDASTGVRIADSEVEGYHDCVYVQYSEDVEVAGNRVRNCRYGIHVMFSLDVDVEGNVARDSYVGIAAMYSRRIHVTGNSALDNNEWSEGFGILVVHLLESVIANNTAVGNVVGLAVAYLGGRSSVGVSIAGNRVVGNFVGLGFIGSGAEGLRITGNEFAGNVVDAAPLAYSTRLKAVFTGNSWSGYGGGRFELRSVYAATLPATQMHTAYLAVTPARFLLDALGGPVILVDEDARPAARGVETSLAVPAAALAIYLLLRRV